MKARTALAVVLVLSGTGLCVRLGFWQIGRWHEKQALNAAMRSAVAAPPLAVGAAIPPADSVAGRKVELRGRFDETRQLLLSGRVQARLPGVEVVTPLLVSGDSLAVLVDRGWLYAPDAARARPQEYRERETRPVVGIARPIGRGAGRLPMLALESDSIAVWSAHLLDLDSLRARLPYRIAPFVVVELPGAGVPDKPLRGTPRPLDEFMHVSYATQWFLFGAILLGGSLTLAWSRRRGQGPEPGPPPYVT